MIGDTGIMQEMERRPRQADIAREAGVSVSTVSRALANEPGISADMREEIRKVAGRLGYRAKAEAAIGPARLAGPALALVPVERATTELGGFYEGILAGLKEAAELNGSSLVIRLIRGPGMTGRVVQEQIESARAAGLFLVGLDPEPELRAWLGEKAIPTVLVNGADPELELDCVSPANFYAARQATQRLLAAGHRHIVHVTGLHRHTIRERGRGFEAALARAPDARSHLAILPMQGAIAEEARMTMARMLEERPEITAAFCLNDMVAVGVMEAVEAAGRRIPDDFSIMGFDDLPLASMTTPRLSTMRVEREAIGREAHRLMRRRLAEPEAEAQQTQLAIRFVAGGTIGPDPKSR